MGRSSIFAELAVGVISNVPRHHRPHETKEMNKRQRKKALKKENAELEKMIPFVMMKMLTGQMFTEQDAKVMERISEETCN